MEGTFGGFFFKKVLKPRSTHQCFRCHLEIKPPSPYFLSTQPMTEDGHWVKLCCNCMDLLLVSSPYLKGGKIVLG